MIWPHDSASTPNGQDDVPMLPTAARKTYDWWLAVPDCGIPTGPSRPMAGERGPVHQTLEATQPVASESDWRAEQTISSQVDWRELDYDPSEAEYCLGPDLQALLLADPPEPSSLGPTVAPVESGYFWGPQAAPLNFYEETPDRGEEDATTQFQPADSNTSAVQPVPDANFAQDAGTTFYLPTGYGLPYVQPEQPSFLPAPPIPPIPPIPSFPPIPSIQLIPPIPPVSDSTLYQSLSSFPLGENQGAPEDTGHRLAEAYRLVYEDQLRRASSGGLSNGPAPGHQAVVSAPAETWQLPPAHLPALALMLSAEAQPFHPRIFAGLGEQPSQDLPQPTMVQPTPAWNPIPELKTPSEASNISGSKSKELYTAHKMEMPRATPAHKRTENTFVQTRPAPDQFPRWAGEELTAEQIPWLDDYIVYMIKPGSEIDVRASIDSGIWSSSKDGNERLHKAFGKRKQGSRMLLLFSVGSSGKFCGLAEMIGPCYPQAVTNIWSSPNPGGHYTVHWIMVKDASFAAFSHLLDPDNQMEPVTCMRDSCRINPDVARETVMVYLRQPRGPSLIDRSPHWFRNQINKRFAHLREGAGPRSFGPPETSKRPFKPTPGSHKGSTRAGASAAGYRRAVPGPAAASYHDNSRLATAADQSRRKPEESANAQARKNQPHDQTPRAKEHSAWAAVKKPEKTE